MKYSQNYLAKVLGVSQTSIAHYEAGTRQPTIDTLMEISSLFDVTIDSLVGNAKLTKVIKSEKMSHEDLIKTLVEALVSKKENCFIEIMDTSVYPFYQIHSVIEDVLKEVMYHIGLLWEKGTILESDEHYATNIVHKIIAYLSIKTNESLKNRKAISFTVGSEKHTLGLEMINICLQNQGVNTMYLGNDLPIRSIEKVIKEFSPNYIFISVTMSESMNSLLHVIDYLNDKFMSDIIIGVGGQGIIDNQNIRQHDNLYILRNVEELIDLLHK